MNIIVNGAYGKMGRTLRRVIEEGYGNCKVSAAVDSAIPYNIGGGYYGSIWDAPGNADAIIDFSSPLAVSDVVDFAVENRIALVIGTTGHKDKSKIFKATEKIPVFYSGNMSKGIYAVTVAAESILRIMPDCDSEITEIYHKDKKDSPGGTALMLSNILNINNEIKSLRIGDVVGTHSIYFGKPGETITITHRVNDRRIFAEGAIDAARYIMRKANGLYSINDLYGL